MFNAGYPLKLPILRFDFSTAGNASLHFQVKHFTKYYFWQSTSVVAVQSHELLQNKTSCLCGRWMRCLCGTAIVEALNIRLVAVIDYVIDYETVAINMNVLKKKVTNSFIRAKDSSLFRNG